MMRIPTYVTALTGLVLMSAPGHAQQPTDSVAAERTKYALQVRSQIAGREQEPAKSVFKNLEILGDMPAGQLVAIMNMGFGRSLGVSCTHCHDTNDFSSDDKKEKKIARAMWRMVQTLNSTTLPQIPEFADRKAIVNCTTCHRGQKKPAINMPTN